MIATPDDILRAFSALSIDEQRQVAEWILRQATCHSAAISTEDVPSSALDEIAIELFQAYDAEESAHAET